MPITLAQLIKEARIRQEPMTQGDLAKAVGTSLENITAIENSRNRQPKPDILAGLSRVLEIRIEDIYAAITGTLNHYPWDKVGDLDLKDPELELMFQQVDSLLEGEAKERVKSFIRFTLDEERRRIAKEKETRKSR
ncbi:MAG: hypothetical protein A9183_00820 [Dehalococcoides mccartyi]|uniref:helix-turn-helix transcriptional regulator n=1 Tax=Dehalococcoides mccartyi TaxID=61435 RepID=UPI0008049D15|nr:helix-turn-helix transcriptional regulator [Dehalococcoides mccartyi]OBW62951.1 MAG: hypothetical protein A9183_00820 [Dehalococcoides mccartyi]